MNAVQSYLHLTGDYADCLRWSTSENVLLYSDGGAQFAFAEEIAEFLDGFVSQRRLIHFGLLTNMLQLLRWTTSPTDLLNPGRQRLWQLFKHHGKSLRHAGAFAAQLCRHVPVAMQAKDAGEIVQRLRRQDGIIHWYFMGSESEEYYPLEEPPWSPQEFETRILQELDGFSDDEVQCWLEHGCWPVGKAGQQLADVLPVTLMGRLGSLLDRPRLRGIKAFITQLAGALTLPPRRLSQQDLPLGGYSDVTNRGKVEQLLLSQFALDEVDFFRRFAEHELLFYRREDPNHPTRQELVVLLDQGVRTWGNIRLVLAAALLAMGKQASQRKMNFLLTTTRTNPQTEREDHAGTLIDPLEVSEEELGRLVEASDLSKNPGAALEGVLESTAGCPRDVVLLTHPRNLDDADVRAAARRARPGLRLFALSLDRHGLAVLNEMRHGSAVPIRQFHVDLTPTPEHHPEPVAKVDLQLDEWTGHVEPAGFPFRFGVEGKIEAFDFDCDGRYLLTASGHGLLHLWEVEDGKLAGMLPRAYFSQSQGKAATEIARIVGVHGGFVVVCRSGVLFRAVHYHLEKRHCTVYALDNTAADQAYSHLEYSAAHHCFLAQRPDQSGESIDLASGERFVTKTAGKNNRAHKAWLAWERHELPSRQLVIDFSFAPFVMLSRKTAGQVIVSRVEPPWEPFIPLANGEPMLKEAKIVEAQIGGKHLALRVTPPGIVGNTLLGCALQVFRHDGVLVKHALFGELDHRFRLSSDGRLLAHQVRSGVVRFGRVDRDPGTSQTWVGGFAQTVSLILDRHEMYIFPGAKQIMHHVRWGSGVLTHDRRHLRDDDTLPPGQRANAGSIPAFLQGDLKRWTVAAVMQVIAACDRYGQVAVFDRRNQLVCMFITFRDRLAGWMPDGTCFGPTIMTGKPAHVDAMEKLGRALLQAEAVIATSASD